MSGKAQYIVVVGTDYSKMAGLAVDEALQLATLHEGSEVHAIYVESGSLFSGTHEDKRPGLTEKEVALDQLQKNIAEHVAHMPAGLKKSSVRRVVVHVGHGSAAQGVAQLAADVDADIVVVGSHGARGIQRLLGSVADRVSHLARCPVYIVRPKDHAHDSTVPEIEPICPDCLAARVASGGANLWCARHSEHHVRAHGFAYSSDGSDGVYTPASAAYGSTPGLG